MSFSQLLKENREAIVASWFDLIIDSFPADSSGFLREQRDQFRNPIGHTIREEAGVLFDCLVHGQSPETMTASLDKIVRIRSVQESTAAEAVSFVFSLKVAIREVLADQLKEDDLYPQLADIDSAIDRLALAAFDNFMHCKEQIYEISAREVKNRSAMLIRNINRMYGDPYERTDRQKGKV